MPKSMPSCKSLRPALHLLRTIRRARIDPNVFLPFCFADPSGRALQQAELHRDLQNFLLKQTKALIELPRDHGKSTQVCGRLVWELGRDPSLRIKLVSASDPLAADRSRFLRDAIETNSRVHMVFPHLRRGRRWAADAFSIVRPANVIGPSVAAFGVGAAATGTRADLLVCDDIVDVKSLYSKADRDRVAAYFTDNLLNLLEPDGRFWGLYTPWHADDLNARLKKNSAFALFRRAISNDLQSIWPAKWPREKLDQRRREIGAAAFARGYRLTPVADEEIVIRPEWVQFWNEPPERYDRVVLSIDPAVTAKATADASALVLLGLHGTQVDCLLALARRIAAPQLVELIDQLDREHQPDVILFETNGAFEAVRDLLVKQTRFGAKVQGVKQSRSKMARCAAFAVRVQNGSFRLKDSHRELFEEMTTFPFGEHDDLLDAAATGTAYLLTGNSDPRVWI